MTCAAGRRSAQRVVVRGSGNISANDRVQLSSYTVLDVCGTINVTGSGTGDKSLTRRCPSRGPGRLKALRPSRSGQHRDGHLPRGRP